MRRLKLDNGQRDRKIREKQTHSDDRNSYINDKGVQDNIVESWLCVDCGINTHPGSPSGPEMRIAFGLGAESVDLYHTRECEIYSVRRSVWKQAGMKPWGGCLCIGCLETRIARKLKPKDFDHHDRKVWARLPCTERLLDRPGYAMIAVRTEEGEKEVIISKDAAAQIMSAMPAGELPWMEE